MRLTINQSDLSRALGLVRPAVDARGMSPILSCVLLSARESGLGLAATNLDMSLTATVPASADEPGRLAIPAKLLSEFVSSLPAGTITLESGKANRAQVKAGGYVANIAVLDPDDWPEPVEIVGPTLLLPATSLRNGITQVVDCCANDETRPALAGVHWRANGNSLVLAAADGFRLATRLLPLPDPVSEPIEAIVPRTAMECLKSLLAGCAEPVGVQVGTVNVRVTGPGWTLTSRKINGRFPSYEQIIPTAPTICAIVDRKALAEAVKVANLFAREASDIIRLDASAEGLVVSALSVETGDSTTTLHCELTGEPLKIAFNGKYLASMLAIAPGEQVSLEGTIPARPGLWRAIGTEGWMLVLMPMSGAK